MWISNITNSLFSLLKPRIDNFIMWNFPSEFTSNCYALVRPSSITSNFFISLSLVKLFFLKLAVVTRNGENYSQRYSYISVNISDISPYELVLINQQCRSYSNHTHFKIFNENMSFWWRNEITTIETQFTAHLQFARILSCIFTSFFFFFHSENGRRRYVR